MIINNNLAAVDTWRQLSLNERSLNSSLAKLSSGLRINTAADDAAGLAISEKMRAQINGLNQAQRNAQDGISMIQTAEGALGEIHTILQRMRELAVQASNDTLTTLDRQQLQKEVDQLSKEISRISNTTQFNTKNLLAGGFQNQTLQIGANANQTLSFSVGAMDAASLGVTAKAGATVTGGAEITSAALERPTGAMSPLATGQYTLSGTIGAGSQATTGAVGGLTLTVDQQTNALNGYTVNYADGGDGFSASALIDTASQTITITGDFSDGDSKGIFTSAADLTSALNTALAASGIKAADGSTVTAAITGTASIATAGTSGTLAGGANPVVNLTLLDENGQKVGMANNIDVTTSGAISLTNDGAATGDRVGMTVVLNSQTVSKLSVGATFDDNSIDVVAKDSSAAVTANGVVTAEATVEKGILVDTQANAEAAVAAIDKAINVVSSQRANFGALQNRLEHTINNLGAASENLQAAESRIRDVDMAQEIMNFTKEQILVQAGTSMLSQAKALPQTVLQLLR